MSKVQQALLKEGIRVMGSREREALVQELEEIKADLDPNNRTVDSESRPNLIQNRPKMLARKKTIEDMLNKDDDMRAKGGGERDRLVSRIKQLEELIKKDRLSIRQVSLKPGSADFEKAVQQQVYCEKSNGKLILEWQQLKRRLEPDNPLADNVELLDI